MSEIKEQEIMEALSYDEKYDRLNSAIENALQVVGSFDPDVLTVEQANNIATLKRKIDDLAYTIDRLACTKIEKQWLDMRHGDYKRDDEEWFIRTDPELCCCILYRGDDVQQAAANHYEAMRAAHDLEEDE